MEIIRASDYLYRLESWRRTMQKLDQIEDLRVMKEAKRMVALSSAKAGDSIAIFGPRSLEYLVALLRSGFNCVACISSEGAGPCGEPIDHVFVNGPLEDRQLASVIGSIGWRLRREGVIVARLRDAGQDQVISRALHEAGLFELAPACHSSGNVLAAHFIRPSERLSIAA